MKHAYGRTSALFADLKCPARPTDGTRAAAPPQLLEEPQLQCAGAAGGAAALRRGQCLHAGQPPRSSPRLEPLEDLAWARTRPPAAPTRPLETARPQAGGAQRHGCPHRAELRPAAAAPQRWEGAAAERGPQVPVAGGATPTPKLAPPSRPPLHRSAARSTQPWGSRRSAATSTWPAERGAVALTVAAGAAPLGSG